MSGRRDSGILFVGTLVVAGSLVASIYFLGGTEGGTVRSTGTSTAPSVTIALEPTTTPPTPARQKSDYLTRFKRITAERLTARQSFWEQVPEAVAAYRRLEAASSRGEFNWKTEGGRRPTGLSTSFGILIPTLLPFDSIPPGVRAAQSEWENSLAHISRVLLELANAQVRRTAVQAALDDEVRAFENWSSHVRHWS